MLVERVRELTNREQSYLKEEQRRVPYIVAWLSKAAEHTALVVQSLDLEVEEAKLEMVLKRQEEDLSHQLVQAREVKENRYISSLEETDGALKIARGHLEKCRVVGQGCRARIERLLPSEVALMKPEAAGKACGELKMAMEAMQLELGQLAGVPDQELDFDEVGEP